MKLNNSESFNIIRVDIQRMEAINLAKKRNKRKKKEKKEQSNSGNFKIGREKSKKLQEMKLINNLSSTNGGFQ